MHAALPSALLLSLITGLASITALPEPVTTVRPAALEAHLRPASVGLSLAAAPATASVAPASAPTAPPSSNTLREEALRLWTLRGDVRQNEVLIKALDRWLQKEPNNVEALNLQARAIYLYVYLHEAGGSTEQKLTLMARGLETARKAARVAPQVLDGDFWAAVNLAVYGKLKGPMESVSSFGEITERLARVEAKDTRFFHGGIWRFQGRMVDQVPAPLRFLKGYDLNDAYAFYKKSLQMEPNYLQTYEFLAECLLQDDQRDEARKVLEKALRLNPEALPDVVPENKVVMKRLQRLYQREFKGS